MPLKLLLSPLNQNENQPDLGPLLQLALTLSEVVNLHWIMTLPTLQTAVGPDCVQTIFPTIALLPPAPTTFHVPAAVIGDGGKYLLPTKLPLAFRPL